MSEDRTGTGDLQVQERIRRLAAEKAAQHLIFRLIERLNPLLGMERMLPDVLNAIVDTIGGTNIKLYYWDRQALQFMDFLGTRKVIDAFEDPLARRVAEEKQFIEVSRESQAAMLRDGVLQGSCSWGFPLLVGEELLGLVILENLHISSQALGKYLPVFFNHMALILSNELRSEERVRSEAALQESRSLLARSQELAHVGSWELELATQRLTWSDETYRIFGLAPQSLPVTYRGFFEFVHPEDRDTLAAAYERSMREGADSFEMEHRFFRAGTGEIGFAHEKCIHMRDESGRVLRSVGMVMDITDRKQKEEVISRRESQARSMLQTAMDAVWLLGPDAGFLEVNDTACRMLGYTREELLRLKVVDVEAVESAEDNKAHIQKVLREGRDLFESNHVRKDGGIFPVEVSVTYLPDQSQMVAFVRDISERKLAAQHQLVLQGQLQQARRMESLGRLAGGVAHDMNNVLAAILGLASANIDAQPPGSLVHRAFETIIKATIRGGNMVKSLLSFARQNPAEEKPLDLNTIIQEEISLLERSTLARLRLVMELAPELRPIRGDATSLAHAFMNLYVNAADAMPGDGTLTLRTRNLDDQWVEVLVADTGTGMSREVLEKALDPFFTTKGVDKGTGLGLSLAYSTVTAHHGVMELESEPGRGTRVTMRFPSCEPEAARPAPAQTALSGGAPKALKVLLVDDDELIQSSMQTILEVLGQSVAAARTGEEALAMLEAGLEPDLVILDMNMPGLGGAGTLPRLRALRPTLPVLLATGRADQTALNLVDAHPHVTLLSKPFTMDQLKQHLVPRSC